MHTLMEQDYTVGWLCALPLELTSAMAMLEERQEPLQQDPGTTLRMFSAVSGNIVTLLLPPFYWKTLVLILLHTWHLK